MNNSNNINEEKIFENIINITSKKFQNPNPHNFLKISIDCNNNNFYDQFDVLELKKLEFKNILSIYIC